MKRLTLLFLCSALLASAQEVRLARSAILKSGRVMVSLKAGTMVDLLARDGETLTVRFNNVTGVIPASSLADATAAKPESAKPSAPPQKSGSSYVNAVNKAKANVAKHEQNDAKAVDEVLK